MWDLGIPEQGWNPGPSLWEPRVLATGPPGKLLAQSVWKRRWTQIPGWSGGGTAHSHGTREGGQGLRTPPPPRPADVCCSRLMAIVKQAEQLSLGVFHPAFTPIETVRQDLQDWLPADVHILASQRLGISLTHWPGGENVIVTDFATRDEVIEVSRGQDAGPGSRCVSAISYPSDLQAPSRADSALGPWEGGADQAGDRPHFVY